MATFGLSALTVAILLAFAGWVVVQARKSRESALAWKLRKAEIALHDAEQALANTVAYYSEEVGRLKARLAEAESGVAVTDRKFRQAKAAFARRYHPDRHDGGGIEAQVRTEVFRDFWAELQRIEGGR